MRHTAITLTICGALLSLATPPGHAAGTPFDGLAHPPRLHVTGLSRTQPGYANSYVGRTQVNGKCERRTVGSVAQTPDPLPVLPGNQRLRFTFRTPVKPTRIVLTDEESYSTLSESYQRSTLHTHLSKRHSGWQLTSKSTIAPGAHEYLLLEFRYKTPCDGSASEESWYYHLVAAVS